MKTNQIAFYSAILTYIKSDVEVDELIPEILKLAEASSPSWEATEESVRKLEQCINRQSEVEDDHEWSTTKNDFTKAAFKDLSVLKNPVAMDLFDRLAKTCLQTYAQNEDLLIWAKSVKERPDGSAVIVLHVSDLERFRKIIEDHDFVDGSTECNTLEECIQIGS
jgi:hypothetical protein